MSHFGPQLAANLEGAASNAAIDDGTIRTLGDFRLIEEIGRGGMGVVYLAEQISLGRKVALKVLPFAAFLDSRCLQRFKQEAQAAAMLRHPNIVNVHCVGCERGVHYYAMELVEGESLATIVEQLKGQLSAGDTVGSTAESDTGNTVVRPTAAAARHELRYTDTSPWNALSTQYSQRRSEYFRTVAHIVSQIADAIHYAHEQGVVHRDLKPSNLLLDYHGHAWVTDFGLAHIQGDPSLTITGDLLGTLRYMSPEQAEGRKVLDHRTDIYSLGLTLYELLALRPAFDGRRRAELLQQITDSQPPPLRALARGLPRDLETIVLKALARQTEQRYESAAELAEDLRRFLHHQPVRARRTSRLRQWAHWVQRHRLTAVALVASLLTLIALSVVGPLVAIDTHGWPQQSSKCGAKCWCC